MKRIKIFLASSIEDLREDRLQIGDFFRQLNDIYMDSGIYFSLIKCEDYDNAISSGGKQQEYDREIRESELVFFLFFRKVGDYTKHEFEVALEAFKNQKKPKIVTYFKYINTIDEAKQEVRDFMQMLDREMKHYYNTYGNIDTLKLGILMQIKMMKLDNVDVKLEDGMVWMNDQVVARAENIPMLRGNKALWDLREKYLQLVAELDRCCDVYQAEKTPKNLMALSKTSAEQEAVQEQLKAVEKATMELLTTVVEITSDGRVLTHRLKEALKYFNQGDYAAVEAILRDEERENELQQAQMRAETAKNEIQGHVEEELLAIKTAKAQGITEDRAQKILKSYQKIMELVEKHDLDKAVLYDYADFLYHQRRLAEAISVAKRLEWYYSNPSIEVKEEQKAALYLLLSGMYQNMHRRQEAEDAASKAMGIYVRLAEQNPAVFEPNLAHCYGILAVLYRENLQREKAEEFLDKTSEIFTRLAGKNPAAYEAELAQWCTIRGIFYCDNWCYEKAEEALSKASAIFSRLAEKSPEAYEKGLADCCAFQGLLHNNTGRYEEAEKAYSKALEIFTRLVEKNPEAYEGDLANNYNALGSLYKNTQHYEDALEAYGKALEIYTRLAEKKPEAYEENLANCYNTLGLLYNNTHRYEAAEEACGKALEIYTRLVEKNPEAYEENLANCYNTLGLLYNNTHRYETAEEAYGKELEINARLAERIPEVYEENLANCYNMLGLLYNNTQHYEDALEAYGKALEIYTRLAEKNPEIYGQELETCSSNLRKSIAVHNFNSIAQKFSNLRQDSSENDRKFMELLRKQNPVNNDPALAKRWIKDGLIHATTLQYRKAEEAFGKALGIYTCLAEQNPEIYEPKLADTLWNFYEIYEAQKQTEKLQAVCRNAQPLFEKLAQKDPNRYQEKADRIRNFLSET